MVYTARLQTLWQVKIGDDYGVVAKAAQAHSWNPIVKCLVSPSCDYKRHGGVLCGRSLAAMVVAPPPPHPPHSPRPPHYLHIDVGPGSNQRLDDVDVPEPTRVHERSPLVLVPHVEDATRCRFCQHQPDRFRLAR